MINLLPPDYKKSIRTGRNNIVLLRYNILLVAAAIFLAIASVFVYFVLVATQSSAEKTTQENIGKASDYRTVKKEAQEFRENLQTAKSILDNNINYSEAVTNIAKALPSGVVLDNLSLDATTFGKPMTIEANARSYSRALALKDSFQDSPLFSDVHFSNIASNQGEDKSAYPVKVTLNLIISKRVVAP